MRVSSLIGLQIGMRAAEIRRKFDEIVGCFQNCNSFRAKYYRPIYLLGNKISQLHFLGEGLEEKAAAKMEMSAPTKLPSSVLGRLLIVLHPNHFTISGNTGDRSKLGVCCGPHRRP